MKKTMFAAVAALVLAGSLAAQPTVHSNVPPANYYQAWTWPTFTDSMGDVQHWEGGYCTDQEAYLIENCDTLTIYGIAAALSTMELLYPKEWGDIVDDFQDTSYTEVWDLLRLYVSEEDTDLRQVGACWLHHGLIGAIIEGLSLSVYYNNTGY